MNDVRLGAQAFVEQLLACGVRWIFGNPGTTEQTVIDQLQDYDGIDLVFALHEGVAVAAADGYARASGEPGVVELHAGPGLGNGIGNIYNAFVSHTPMLVYAGQSEQRSLYLEPVLSGDLVGMARPVTKWAYEIRTAEEIPQVVRRALKVATTPPCGPVLLAIPYDLTNAPCSAPVLPSRTVRAALRPDTGAIEEAARLLLAADAPLVLVGDGVATSGAIAQVGALASLLGAPIVEGAAFETVIDPDDPLRAGRLPVDPTAAERRLAPYDAVIAVGTRVLAQVFPEPGLPLGSRDVVHIGLDPWEAAKSQPSTVVLGDEREAVRELTERLDALLDDERRTRWADRHDEVAAAGERAREAASAAGRAYPDRSPMSPQRAIAELAAAMPDDACVVDEAMSAYELTARDLRRRPGRWFRGAGGIGMGLPRPIGVQLAMPDRPVVAIVGDGASMYSLTALWTAAHHALPIVWVILDNRAYRTLKQNVLASRPAVGGREFVGADLTGPEIDFVSLATGLGVTAHRVTEPDAIGPTLRNALASGRPTLIDLVVDGDVPAPGR